MVYLYKQFVGQKEGAEVLLMELQQYLFEFSI